MVWVREDLKDHEQGHLPLDCVTQTPAEESLVHDFIYVDGPLCLFVHSPAKSRQTMAFKKALC